MRNGQLRLAEWIVARFTTHERAGAIVGDLMELIPQRGFRWFWVSIARVVFSFAWRFPVAIIGAFFIAGICISSFGGPYQHFALPHRGFSRVDSVVRFMMWVDALLAFVAPYAALRFGLRDVFTRLCAISAVTITALLLFWWSPVADLAVGVIVAGVCAAALFSESWRRGLAAVGIAMAAAICFGLATMYSAELWQVRGYAGGMYWVRSWVPGVLIWSLVFFISSVCSSAHKRLIFVKSI